MSNLSELLPTGGGQNAVDFVATGNLASGQAVALKTDGTVEAVTGAAGSPVTGAEATVVGATSTNQRPVIGYHLASNKVVVFWAGTNQYLYASVGTVSGTTVTYATAQVITSAVRVPNNVIYDPDQEVLIVDVNNNGQGWFQAFSVSSGGTLTNGSEVYYSAYDMKLGWGGFSYDTTANKTVFAFGGNGSYFSDAYGFVFSMTCSGTTLTLNTSSTHVFASVNVNLATVSYDPVANKHIVYYQNGAVGTYHATSVTVSGNSFTSGTTITPTGFKGESTAYSFTYSPVAGKHILFVYDPTDSKSSSAIAFNISGSNITYGSPLEYRTNDARYAVGVYDTASDRVIAVSATSGGAAYWYVLTINNLTLTAATGGTIAASNVNVSAGLEGIFVAYDSTSRSVVTSYNGVLYGSPLGPFSRVLKTFAFPAIPVIGITSEAISNGATGAINTFGGINTAQTGLTIGSDYYVQTNGSLSTTTSTAKVGQAISATTINLKDLT
mgnify:FL=1|jgi:hypothetical protein